MKFFAKSVNIIAFVLLAVGLLMNPANLDTLLGSMVFMLLIITNMAYIYELENKESK